MQFKEVWETMGTKRSADKTLEHKLPIWVIHGWKNWPGEGLPRALSYPEELIRNSNAEWSWRCCSWRLSATALLAVC
jgi:hypothetical protein